MSLSLHLSGLNTLPAMLNNLSTGDSEEGTPRTSLASFDNKGYFSFQNFAGLVHIETLSSNHLFCMHSNDFEKMGSGIKLNNVFAFFLVEVPHFLQLSTYFTPALMMIILELTHVNCTLTHVTCTLS